MAVQLLDLYGYNAHMYSVQTVLSIVVFNVHCTLQRFSNTLMSCKPETSRLLISSSARRRFCNVI